LEYQEVHTHVDAEARFGGAILSPHMKTPKSKTILSGTQEIGQTVAPGNFPRDLRLASRGSSSAGIAAMAAHLIETMDKPGFFDHLCAGLAQSVEFDYFIVYHFEEGHVAQLIYTNLNRAMLIEQMAPYEQGLYLLDPFYVAAMSQGYRGLYRMDEVAPANFRESEYFLGHYKKVPIAEELRYLVRIDSKQWVHVFLERDVQRGPFSTGECEVLRDLEPLVDASLLRYWQWHRMGETLCNSDRTPLGFGLRTVIGSLKGAALTEREIDVVELVIKGHSSKSIADILGTAEGTITNHRRNIYAKLRINSQGQLFHHFLQQLFG